MKRSKIATLKNEKYRCRIQFERKMYAEDVLSLDDLLIKIKERVPAIQGKRCEISYKDGNFDM